MKKKERRIALIAVIFCMFVCAAFLYILIYSKVTPELSSNEAVKLIQAKHSEFVDYPSDKLPPREIRMEKGMTGWYVAFVQEGSGVPVISATCFFVGQDRSIREIGRFEPGDNGQLFNLQTCRELS